MLLDGIDVEWFFDDEDGGFVAGGVGVELGDGAVGVDQGKGLGARFDARMEHAKGLGDGLGNLGVGAEQKVSVAFRRARTNAGKMPEGIDAVEESLGEHKLD